jgi:hypothetical protein
MNMDKVSKWMAAAGVLVLLLLCWWSPPFGYGDKDRNAFMNECQMDGLKHYQCVSLWNGGGIPVFRSRDMLPLDVN